MSNHFPSVPSMDLQSISYNIRFSDYDETAASGSFAPTADFSLSNQFISEFTGFSPLFQFTFSVPGVTGSFDQDAVEALIVTVATDCCQAIADSSGQALAEVQASTVIYRGWSWTDSTGNFSTGLTGDTVPYP